MKFTSLFDLHYYWGAYDWTSLTKHNTSLFVFEAFNTLWNEPKSFSLTDLVDYLFLRNWGWLLVEMVIIETPMIPEGTREKIVIKSIV